MDLHAFQPFQPLPSFWEVPVEQKVDSLCFTSLFKESTEETIKRNDTFDQLEIVSNKNKKILIKVPSRPSSYTWEKLNFKTIPTIDEMFKKIPNPFDLEARTRAFNLGGYKLNYQSGYAPAELQTKHKDPEDYTKKNHFIRQKQTQANLNLKRTCGVSYVKTSESEQKDVNHIYKKLPPLVYQCSSGCTQVEGWEDQFDYLFNSLLNGKNVIVCSLFHSSEEAILREYLLNPSTRNKVARERVVLARKFYNFWMLFQDSLCLVIHYQYDENQIIKSIQLDDSKDIAQQLVDFVGNSQISICLLFKKSVSGRKAFLKSVGLWNEQQDNVSMTTSTSEQEIEQVSTKFVLQIPKIPIKSQTTAEELFQQFTAILNKDHLDQQKQQQQQSQTTSASKQNKEQKQKKETQTSNSKKSKKRAKVQDFSDIRENSGACQPLINFLTKEDGYHNINTCSIRMEMYVDEKKWLEADTHNKDILNSLIKRVEYHFQQKLLIMMMNKRFKAFEKGIGYILKKSQKIKEISTVGLSYQPYEQLPQWNTQFSQSNIKALKTQKMPVFVKQISLDILKLPKDQSSKELSYLQYPLYCITTRDSFAYDLITKTTEIKIGERTVNKNEFFFDPNNCPANFRANFIGAFPQYQVGTHTYCNYFTNEELLQIEKDIFEMELKAFDGHYLPMTAQISFAQSNNHASVRRTKFFFGYRYMWTKCQLAEPHSMVAAGVRRDVSQRPEWMNRLIQKLETDNIIPKNFINSVACNVYHDGKEGLAQHFDDAVRFKQPIFTIRVFSDCRLSFGSQFYGFCNGAFAVPLPRGCICVMEEGSYAANAIKHCVRPCDMTGKSAALILRQMHQQVTEEAINYDENVDLPCQLSSLSIREDAVPYGELKRLEAEILAEN